MSRFTVIWKITSPDEAGDPLTAAKDAVKQYWRSVSTNAQLTVIDNETGQQYHVDVDTGEVIELPDHSQISIGRVVRDYWPTPPNCPTTEDPHEHLHKGKGVGIIGHIGSSLMCAQLVEAINRFESPIIIIENPTQEKLDEVIEVVKIKAQPKYDIVVQTAQAAEHFGKKTRYDKQQDKLRQKHHQYRKGGKRGR